MKEQLIFKVCTRLELVANMTKIYPILYILIELWKKSLKGYQG